MTPLAGPLLLLGIAATVALILGLARARLPRDETALVEAIDAVLPQTQCAQCGYPGCRPYAEAVAAGEALDLCPPGGPATQIALQELLGAAAPTSLPEPVPGVAVIDEARCIGCALCLPACPVDAILGANKFMHTVLSEHCTGCELCVAPCPVDCIDMVARDAAASGTPQ